MPRGGKRPGTGRPWEGVEGKAVWISLPEGAWAEVEAILGQIGESRARALGELLLLGVKAFRATQRPRWGRPLNLEDPVDQEVFLRVLAHLAVHLDLILRERSPLAQRPADPEDFLVLKRLEAASLPYLP